MSPTYSWPSATAASPAISASSRCPCSSSPPTSQAKRLGSAPGRLPLRAVRCTKHAHTEWTGFRCAKTWLFRVSAVMNNEQPRRSRRARSVSATASQSGGSCAAQNHCCIRQRRQGAGLQAYLSRRSWLCNEGDSTSSSGCSTDAAAYLQPAES